MDAVGAAVATAALTATSGREDKTMKRLILIAVLTLGTALGYGAGFASIHRCHLRREAWERHVAKVCLDAANGKGDTTSAPSAEQ